MPQPRILTRRTPLASLAEIGIAKGEHLSWKSILDFYTCTECGRCSDNCPAHRTGKILSPKHLTLALRDHLYGREDELVRHRPNKGLVVLSVHLLQRSVAVEVDIEDVVAV